MNCDAWPIQGKYEKSFSSASGNFAFLLKMLFS
jgi:hypothetical protein